MRPSFAFNIFMNVTVDSETGAVAVLPPLSQPGDFVRFRAEMPLVIAMTACSAGQSNNFTYFAGRCLLAGVAAVSCFAKASAR